MKVSIFIIIIVFQNCDDPNPILHNINEKNQRWTKIACNFEEILYDIDFVDNQNGWIVGDNGIILHTNDGGSTWEKQFCGIKGFKLAVDFVDSKNGWVCGKDSILHTKDGGVTWELQYYQDIGEGYFRDITFLNNKIGFSIGGYGDFGGHGILLKTDDGGVRWEQLADSELPTLTSISINGQDIWICGFGGTILFSNDTGITWNREMFNRVPLPSFTSIQFVDSRHGWVASRDDWQGLFHTEDGGKTWIRRTEESLSVYGVQSFFFIDSLNGWLGTFPGGLTETTNGGKIWKFLDQFNHARIHSLFFINKELGWGVGFDSKDNIILKYTNIK